MCYPEDRCPSCRGSDSHHQPPLSSPVHWYLSSRMRLGRLFSTYSGPHTTPRLPLCPPFHDCSASSCPPIVPSRNWSDDPIGISSDVDKVPFHPYYTIKGTLGALLLVLVLLMLVLSSSLSLLGGPDSYTPASPLNTAPHINPQLYFLFARAGYAWAPADWEVCWPSSFPFQSWCSFQLFTCLDGEAWHFDLSQRRF